MALPRALSRFNSRLSCHPVVRGILVALLVVAALYQFVVSPILAQIRWSDEKPARLAEFELSLCTPFADLHHMSSRTGAGTATLKQHGNPFGIERELLAGYGLAIR